MSSKTATLGVLLVITLVYSPLALAQQPAGSSDWDSVLAVLPGEELIVKLKDGRSVEGKLNRVTGTELSLTRNNHSETLSRDRIFQIYGRKRKAEKGKYAAIGAGIGAGVGLGVGVAKNTPHVDEVRSVQSSERRSVLVSARSAVFYLVRRNESGYSSIRRTRS